jgi:Domain of unknown function (DUF4253)
MGALSIKRHVNSIAFSCPSWREKVPEGRMRGNEYRTKREASLTSPSAQINALNTVAVLVALCAINAQTPLNCKARELIPMRLKLCLFCTMEGNMMTRRSWVGALLSLLGFGVKPETSLAQENVINFDASKFPYPLIVTTGLQALAEFEKQKMLGKGVPVILGHDEDMANLTDLWIVSKPDPAATIAKANTLGEKFDIKAYRDKARDDDNVRYTAKNETPIEAIIPEVGEWPNEPDVMNAPTVIADITTGKPLDRVYIAVFPAKDMSEIPAYLGWGGWNENPPPEVHVAMFRKWKREYGAEVVGMSGDVINLRVERKPKTRKDAMALANEM